MSVQDLTSRRYSQASNRSTSRSVGRSRQARTSASCVASSASSVSRRLRRAMAYNRSTAPAARTLKASRSPRRALSTSSACTLRSFRGRPIWSPTRYGGAQAVRVHSSLECGQGVGQPRSLTRGGWSRLVHDVFQLTSERRLMGTLALYGTREVTNGARDRFRSSVGTCDVTRQRSAAYGPVSGSRNAASNGRRRHERSPQEKE